MSLLTHNKMQSTWKQPGEECRHEWIEGANRSRAESRAAQVMQQIAPGELVQRDGKIRKGIEPCRHTDTTTRFLRLPERRAAVRGGEYQHAARPQQSVEFLQNRIDGNDIFDDARAEN